MTYVDFLIISGSCTPPGMASDTWIRSIGPHKIAHVARQHGYSSMVISRNMDFSFEDFLTICEPLVGPNTVIGISTTFILTWFDVAGKTKNTTIQHEYVTTLKRVLEHFKSKYSTRVLLGGPNANWYMDALGADDYIRGYAEVEVPAYLNRVKNHGLSKSQVTPWTIQSCNFRWHHSDFISPGETLPLELSRGCIFKCQFCTYELLGKQKGTYERDMSLIREELIYNYNEFGVKSYSLTSDTFNDNNDRMNEWCDMLESLPFNITYTGFARLDLLHTFKSTARRLYQTGLMGCHYGIESFDPTAAKSIGKGFNGKHGQAALDELFFDVFDQAAVFFATMIVGLPGENTESYYQSNQWFKQRPWMNVKWNPLFLVNNQKLTSTELDTVGHISNSEFSRNAEEYGYSFPDPDNLQFWKNHDMDFGQARTIAEYLKSELNNTNGTGITNWAAINYISNFGLTASDINQKTPRTIFNLYRQLLDQDLNQSYKTKLLSYVNSN